MTKEGDWAGRPLYTPQHQVTDLFVMIKPVGPSVGIVTYEIRTQSGASVPGGVTSHDRIKGQFDVDFMRLDSAIEGAASLTSAMGEYKMACDTYIGVNCQKASRTLWRMLRIHSTPKVDMAWARELRDCLRDQSSSNHPLSQ